MRRAGRRGAGARRAWRFGFQASVADLAIRIPAGLPWWKVLGSW